MADPTDAIFSARPKVYVGGENQPPLEQGLSRLEIVETIRGLYRCEAEFINWGEGNGSPDFLYFDRKLLDFGKTFTVKLDADVLFDGRIMALEGSYPEGAPPNITVLIEDRFQDLRMTRRTRSFEDVTDADVAGRIASDHGLTTDVSADQPTGQFIGVACKKLGEVWQVGQVCYNATNRGDADGDLLDNIGTLGGTLRAKPAPSTVLCTATFSAAGTYAALA